MRRQTTISWVAAVALLTMCGSPEVKLDETTAEGHEQEAKAERKRAEQEHAAYDPNRSELREVPAPHVDAGAPVLVTVNPTAAHLSAAEAHRRHAHQHELASMKLQAFEDVACKPVAPASRASCPSLIATAVERLPNGIRLRCEPEQVDKVLAEMRCHLAFARARGFDSDYLCPFALKFVRADAAAERTGVDLTSDDPPTVKTLHALELRPPERM